MLLLLLVYQFFSQNVPVVVFIEQNIAGLKKKVKPQTAFFETKKKIYEKRRRNTGSTDATGTGSDGF